MEIDASAESGKVELCSVVLIQACDSKQQSSNRFLICVRMLLITAVCSSL